MMFLFKYPYRMPACLRKTLDNESNEQTGKRITKISIMLNHHDIEHIVHQYFKHFKKLFKKIAHDFAAVDIHTFRVEYKKLRAFLRLLMLEIADAENLNMPRNLKEIYTVTGKTREIQLQLSRIGEMVKAKEKLPAYRAHLKYEIKKLKRESMLWLKHEPLSKMEEKIMAHIPVSLTPATITRFLSARFENINALISGRTIADESLHLIRKNIKDILYVYAIFASFHFMNQEELFGSKNHFDHAAVVADELGKFNDLCIAFTLLRPEWIVSLNHEEKKLLDKISLQWKEEKEWLRRHLLERVLPGWLGNHQKIVI